MVEDDAQVHAVPKPQDGSTNQGGATKTDRDYGDSAGYGSGGSTMDYHEVGDEAADGVKHRRNPLDAVVKIKTP